MIVSRFMRPGDYSDLTYGTVVLNDMISIVGMDPAQHPHRRWEYALMVEAYRQHFGDSGRKLKIADHGCCTGISTPMFIGMGHDVSMYEIWAWGNQEALALRQAEGAKQVSTTGDYRMFNRPLGSLIDEDKNKYDISLCISTLEHVPNETEAFNDLLDSVAPKGMTFLTMDGAPDDTDHYVAAHVRSRIYNAAKLNHLVELGKQKGFSLLGGASEWNWSPECVMVNNYGFASICLVRE